MLKKSFIFIVIVLMICGCSVNNELNNQIQENNYIHQKDITNEENSNNKETINNYDCSFIRTYRIVSKLDGYKSATNTFDYVVVDMFQSFEPIILSIPLNVKSNLENGKYYEFIYSLKGIGDIQNFDDIDKYFQNTTMEKDNGVSSNIKVNLEIRSTAKQGLEQINEDICS